MREMDGERGSGNSTRLDDDDDDYIHTRSTLTHSYNSSIIKSTRLGEGNVLIVCSKIDLMLHPAYGRGVE